MPKIPKKQRPLQPLFHRHNAIPKPKTYNLPSFHNDKPKNKSKLLDKFTKHLMNKEGW